MIITLREVWQKDLRIPWELLEVGNSTQDTDEVALCENLLCENYYNFQYPTVITASIFAKAESDKCKTLTKLIKDHSLEIRDNIRSTVASAQHWEITDPKLEVIIGEMKTGVEQIVGKGLIKNILIPVWHVTRQ